MGAGAGSWEKAQQEGGDPLHRSDGGVGAGIRSWRRGYGGRGAPCALAQTFIKIGLVSGVVHRLC